MKRRARIVPLLLLLLALALAAPPPSDASEAMDRPIMTYGGDENRNHQYRTVLPVALCRQAVVPVGRTLSQPLVLHFDGGVPGPDGNIHQDLVFHLGQTDLQVLTLDGQEVASHWVQSGEHNSVQQISYALRRPLRGDPQGVFYVGTRPAALKVYSLTSLLSSQGGARPLGEYLLEGAQYIVAAPVYIGEHDAGDTVVVPAVDNRFYVLTGLASGRNPPIHSYLPDGTSGWNSATPLTTSPGYFATTVNRGFAMYRLTQDLRVVREDSIPRLALGEEALSQLVREPGTEIFFTAEKTGVLHKLDALVAASKRVTPRTFKGFINTGPSADHDLVYFGFRWSGSTTAGTPGNPEGVLVAVRKSTWEVAWEKRIPVMGGVHNKSWINVTPVIWQSAADPYERRIIVGDARGGLTALDPQGQLRELFLTGESFLPVDCETVEQNAPGYRPTFQHTSQTLLTDNPNRNPDGENSWHNTQGVGTEMSIYKGRLFTGYNHAVPNKSSLVIFRPATNVAVGELKIEVADAGGSYHPLPQDEPLKPGTRVRVTAPVTYQADPIDPPMPIAIWAGFHDGSKTAKTEVFAPFETKEVTFELILPSGEADATLSVTANPALYADRRDYEAGRKLPPGLSAVPAPLPAAWGSAGGIPFGEVWALDNSRSMALLRTARNDCALVGFSADSTVLGSTIQFQLKPWFSSALQAETEAELTVTATPAAGGPPSTISGTRVLQANAAPETVPGAFYDASPGTYRLEAVLTCPDDSNPSNNRRELSVTVVRSKTEQGHSGSANE